VDEGEGRTDGRTEEWLSGAESRARGFELGSEEIVEMLCGETPEDEERKGR